MASSMVGQNTTSRVNIHVPVAHNQRCRSKRLCKAKVNAVSTLNGSREATDAFNQLVSLPYSPRNGQESPKCVAASIEILENEKDTVLSIQVPDYPGLLRVISWVLNGMDLRVKSASLQTQPNGMAHDILTITNMSGEKLTDRAAQEMVDRLQDFVMYCSPSPRAKNSEKMASEGVEICNASHDKFTVITITEKADLGRPGFLLDVASMLSGVGLSVMEAEITPGDEAGKSRIFTFLVCDEHGTKLSTSSSGTVIYILSLLMGQGHAPTVVPSAAGYLHLPPDTAP